MDVEFGNAGDLDTNGTGWFVGFSEWTRAHLPSVGDLRHIPRDQRSHALCMKWMDHPAEDPRGAAKPLSEGRTISVLVSERGRFRIEFSESPDFPEGAVVGHILARHGDFVAWGEKLFHRWFVDEPCTVLTLRWIPESAPDT